MTEIVGSYQVNPRHNHCRSGSVIQELPMPRLRTEDANPIL
jgi:hypothetical protein